MSNAGVMLRDVSNGVESCGKEVPDIQIYSEPFGHVQRLLEGSRRGELIRMLRVAMPVYGHEILCFSARGFNRGSMLIWVEDAMVLAFKALACWKHLSNSSSVNSLL